jgi:hypothetical protein
MRASVFVLTLGLLAGCRGEPEPSRPPEIEQAPAQVQVAAPEAEPLAPEAELPKVDCLATLNVRDNDELMVPVDEDMYDRPGEYTAATFQAGGRPISITERFVVDGEPMLWWRADHAAIHVNAAALSDLTVVSATFLKVGERRHLGTVTPRGREQLGGRELAEFLILAEAVSTYLHIGSTLCLFAEREDERGYRAEFTGRFEYYTHTANFDPIAFALDIGADGTIAVIGIEWRNFEYDNPRFRNRQR